MGGRDHSPGGDESKVDIFQDSADLMNCLLHCFDNEENDNDSMRHDLQASRCHRCLYRSFVRQYPHCKFHLGSGIRRSVGSVGPAGWTGSVGLVRTRLRWDMPHWIQLTTMILSHYFPPHVAFQFPSGELVRAAQLTHGGGDILSVRHKLR